MSDAFVDVSEAFDGWEIELTFTRNTGNFVDGRWVPDIPTTKTFEGVVQNATPDDLKVLDEGMRTEEAIKIHTKYPLVAQIADTTTGDLVTYDSATYLVYNVAKRKIGGYYKAIAIRQ
jgi:hypothetical protein